MSINLQQTYTAIAPGLSVSFQGYGGTSPYVYSIRPGGPGGFINSVSGVYTAPVQMSEDPRTISDTIQVKDTLGAIATASVLVATPLLLLCDILRNQLGLDSNHIYLWDQKIFQPTDDGLYIAVSVPMCKPFGNNISFDGSGSSFNSNQSVNMYATVDVDIISRGPAARDRKEFVLMALQSTYSEQQQEANSFYISKLTHGFINLSQIDGAAIPYRFKISMAMQYAVSNTLPIQYFNTFSTPSVTVNS